MTHSPARSVEAHDADAGGHLAVWLIGVLGAMAIAAGFWFSYAPSSGQLELPLVTIDVPSIPQLLGPLLLVGGGVTVAAALFAGARRDYRWDRNWPLTIVQGALGMVGVVAALLGVLAILDRLGFYTLSSLPF